MKLSLCLIGVVLGGETERIQEQFRNTFEKELDQGVKYYTKKSKGVYKHADEAIELGTSLALTDDDFIDSFKFCDTNNDDQATGREIKACTKRALEFIYKILPGSDINKQAMDGAKKRMKFDYNRDKQLNFDEFKAAVTVLNTALSKTMIDVFDGIRGAKKDGMLAGTMEISAMGVMLSNFYNGVDSRTSRTLLQQVNQHSSNGPGTPPTREDRQNVTEDELRDFLQKIFTKLLEKVN